jgi:hypothetical protein
MSHKLRIALLVILAVLPSLTSLAGGDYYFPKTKPGEDAALVGCYKSELVTKDQSINVKRGYNDAKGNWVKASFTIVFATSTKAYRVTGHGPWKVHSVAFDFHDIEKMSGGSHYMAVVGKLQNGQFKATAVYYQ